MPHICAIFTHYAGPQRTLTCLERLAHQTRRPDNILVINNSVPQDPVLEQIRELDTRLFTPGTISILQMEANLGNAGGCSRGIAHAFEQLGADYVWVLDDDSWPRPHTLEALLNVPDDEETVRMSLVVDPAKGDELSWPLTIATGSEAHPWENAVRRDELPDVNAIPSRGGWLGALYPRAAWQKAGVPTEELFIRGEDEEYPWKVRNAGFRFITVRDSELEHPSAKRELIRYRIGSKTFFFEPGLPISRLYYKVRNWAWLQRLQRPHNYPHRLAACGAYLVLCCCGMLSCGDFRLGHVHTLLRALHNGFYGKLRPY
ncbi:MAG: glycosyltransferase [Akkermansia sp.]|nr:glycosyltransferase [Akkermansia sp.]